MDGVEALISVILGLTLYGAAAMLSDAVQVRGRRRPGVDPGPVPGYAWYPGEAVDAGRLGLAPERWSVESLEAFHKPGRRRLVLTLRARGGPMGLDERARALEAATMAAMIRAGADVVVAEVSALPQGPSSPEGLVALRSADGRGWSGRERVPGFVLEGPGVGSTGG